MKRVALNEMKKGNLSFLSRTVASATRFSRHSSQNNTKVPPGLAGTAHAMREDDMFTKYCPGHYHPVGLVIHSKLGGIK